MHLKMSAILSRPQWVKVSTVRVCDLLCLVSSHDMASGCAMVKKIDSCTFPGRWNPKNQSACIFHGPNNSALCVGIMHMGSIYRHSWAGQMSRTITVNHQMTITRDVMHRKTVSILVLSFLFSLMGQQNHSIYIYIYIWDNKITVYIYIYLKLCN